MNCPRSCSSMRLDVRMLMLHKTKFLNEDNAIEKVSVNNIPRKINQGKSSLKTNCRAWCYKSLATCCFRKR